MGALFEVAGETPALRQKSLVLTTLLLLQAEAAYFHTYALLSERGSLARTPHDAPPASFLRDPWRWCFHLVHQLPRVFCLHLSPG
jgi:hypothetical protein